MNLADAGLVRVAERERVRRVFTVGRREVLLALSACAMCHWRTIMAI